jgi:hypothetical protein
MARLRKNALERAHGSALTEQEKQAKRARLRALLNGETPKAVAAVKKPARRTVKKAAKRRR